MKKLAIIAFLLITKIILCSENEMSRVEKIINECMILNSLSNDEINTKGFPFLRTIRRNLLRDCVFKRIREQTNEELKNRNTDEYLKRSSDELEEASLNLYRIYNS